ncbi:iron-containing alcohol dehydrogenase [Telmatocola sphagniphila]|uniref:Iron-containing alcohol dehydrogenase n=1 Tax=Telmatocola sphagniphila TaxID=1123043 RepID=A0A8E6B311_9BACT|nr:iron-containing alcohol dehydrogenase [Telmatocola sphagniphila]QVL30171.1 iron-containing alcohol dehydrogenase [Telmatocola sphagniphila]
MIPFDFQPINRVIFGPGTLARIGELCTEQGGKRILLVTDPGLEKAGHPQRAKSFIEAAGLPVFVFDLVKENPTNADVQLGTRFAREQNIDLIVAVGGGSTMDCAKGINFILTNGGNMADYKGQGKAKKPMLPSIGIPTTSGTGSEAQCYALITDDSSHLKMACGDKKAAFRVSILDPELTLSQPRGVTAATGIDAIAHAIESFVCKKATPFSQLYSRSAWQYLVHNLEEVLRNPGNLDARAAMQLGSHFAGVAIENAMLGICHSCANPLTAHYGITHGVAIGLLLPHVIRFNSSVCSRHFEILARDIDEKSAADVAEKISELVAFCGQPNRLRDCGVSESILPLLAIEANEQWTARFNPREVTEKELLQVLQSAW